MSLSAKQYRQYKLIVLLSTGKPISKDALYEELDCSEPTFNRDLRDIREEFQADIRFLKAGSRYQLVSAGALQPRAMRTMREAMSAYEQNASSGPTSGVTLAKEGKKPVSLSLRFSVIRQIDQFGNRQGMNRSQVIEMLVTELLSKKPAK